MKHLDKLAILGGLVCIAGSALKNYAMMGSGFGLAMSSIVTDTFVERDEFYELRRKFHQRERLNFSNYSYYWGNDII